MLDGKDKRGWIRVVEAFIAILIIAGIVLLVVKNDQSSREDVSSRIQTSITSMVGEIQLDNHLRGEIINISDSGLPVEWEEFNVSAPQTKELIIEKTPDYMKCVGKICATNDSCLLSQSPNKTIYAESVIISSDLKTYNPRTLKMFCWENDERKGDSSTTRDDSVTGRNNTTGTGGGGGGGGDTGGGGSGEINYTYITSCMEITSPGSYLVSNNLSGTAPNPCLNIHDVSGVYIDCQNKSLKVPGLVTGQNIVRITNVNDFSLKNCLLPLTNISGTEIPYPLKITNSSQGVISGNNFSGGGVVNVGYSSYLQVLNNDFSKAVYQQGLSNNSRIENNSLEWNYSGAGIIISSDGFGNSIKNNVMNGYGFGSPSTAHLGFDDGIILDTENGAIVSGNTIYNLWDCGIETLGLIQNSVIHNNTIKNSTFCGIGGWYWNSLKNNSFAQNKIEKSGPMFTFNRRYALKTGESFVYFTDNIFTDNIAISPTGYRGYAADIDMNRSNWGEVADNKFTSSNATFTNNDFGTGLGPYISPRSAIIDGGGNKCGPPSLGQGTSPLVCNP